jgi:hypothetical protein
LTLTDFHGYFTESGLELVQVYGSYHLEEFDKKTSDRLIMVFKPLMS